MVFESSLGVRPLPRPVATPPQVWAVDGGQALVADARSLQVFVTRAARVCWAGGRAAVEEEGPLRAWLLGLGQSELARGQLGAPVQDDCSMDVNLLREWGEWEAARESVLEAAPGSLVLVDGDLQPDWRISPDWLPGVMDLAADRSVTLIGVTKHTALAWGGSPLLGVLEKLAEETLGPRVPWWAPVARMSPSSGPGVRVVVGRLDPDARFSFRLDLPGDADPEAAVVSLSAVCDDAAFPGYPYPLAAADRLAACPSWVRDDSWRRIEDLLIRSGIPADSVERAFADRHRLLERY
jgi:hypothetical protein